MPISQFQREGWRRLGPGYCACPECHARVPTNALARASHARACYRKRKAEREAEARYDATVNRLYGPGNE